MRAIRVHEYGGPDVLHLEEIDMPEPGWGEARVMLKAAGVNFVDIYQRSGQYKMNLPYTPGREGGGIVDAVGPNVTDVAPGDYVVFAMHLGAYADYAIVPAWMLAPVPPGIDMMSATAAVPAVRAGMNAREMPTPGWKWLTVQIPLGTVWSEETMYRGALGTLAARAFGPGRGRLLQAAAFGLSHIVDARAAAEPVVGTVVVTAAAGWVFGWLAERSGSLIAPVLVHLAINESGAVAAMTVQRRAARATSNVEI